MRGGKSSFIMSMLLAWLSFSIVRFSSVCSFEPPLYRFCSALNRSRSESSVARESRSLRCSDFSIGEKVGARWDIVLLNSAVWRFEAVIGSGKCSRELRALKLGW